MTTYNIIDLRCPGCGEPANTAEKNCKYCGREVIISTFSSVHRLLPQDVNQYVGAYRQALRDNPDDPVLNTSVAMCYLKLGLYDQASKSFAKAIESDFDNSESFFYAAVCLLKGKRAFLTSLSDIKKIIDYAYAALRIENRGIYHYFLAYVKYDYYAMKRLKVTPDYLEELQNARLNSVTAEDIRFLFDLLQVQKPDVLL